MILKADVRFLGYNAQLVDHFTSFARQAAQAMTIRPSRTFMPIKHTPDAMFPFPGTDAPASITSGASNDIDTHSNSNNNSSCVTSVEERRRAVDSRELSFEYDRWTVNRSPFVHGRHQDQFEIRTYRRNLKLFDADTETIRRWLHYISMNIPAGVGIEYALHDYEKYDPSSTESTTGDVGPVAPNDKAAAEDKTDK
jgi:ribosomal protein S10